MKNFSNALLIIVTICFIFFIGWHCSKLYYSIPKQEPQKTEWKAVISGMDTTLTITDTLRYKYYKIIITSNL